MLSGFSVSNFYMFMNLETLSHMAAFEKRGNYSDLQHFGCVMVMVSKHVTRSNLVQWHSNNHAFYK